MTRDDSEKFSLLREVIRELPDIASLSTLEEGRFIEVNELLTDAVGYSRDEMIGHTSTEIGIWADDAGRSRLRDALINSNFLVKSIEIDFKRKNGEIINCLLSAKIFDLGEKKLLFTVFKDVTEYKKTMKELAESRERFQALHEASFGGIGIHDRGVICEANKGLSDLSGYTGEELIGMEGLALIAPEWRELVLKHIVEGYEKPYEVEGLRKDGSRYYLHIQGKQIPYHGRQMRVTEFRDITEQKQTEEKHRKLEEQLHQIQKMDSIGTLVGGIAHDLNNILTVIQGNADLAAVRQSKNQPITESLAEIKKAVTFAADLTRNLLAFSRRQICEPKVIDINNTIENLYKILSRVISESIAIKLSLADDLLPVLADTHQIEQILMNLAINASDAISAAGKGNRIITIETANTFLDDDFVSAHPGSSKGKNIILSISDDGTGMDKETESRIFEPFFTTKNRGKGTGLGLATVYGIVMQNKGSITVYSEKGKGSTFKIYWPAAESGIETETAHDSVERPAGGTETILLVEDNAAVCSFAKATLESYGYTVVCAENGRKALDIVLKGQKFDLLLTDVVMPEMNGPELAEEIRKRDPYSKILYVSGYTENHIVKNGILDPNICFLPKPYTAEELVRKVREMLDQKTT